MNYVKHIKSNLKGGVDLELGPKTLIVGNNATGKTTITQAIEFALTGTVSEVVGRNVVAKPATLATLSPKRQGELFAIANFEDGLTCSHRMGSKGKKTPVGEFAIGFDPNKVFPLRTVRDAILGEAATARKFFLQWAVGAVEEADILNLIPAGLHSYFKSTLISCSSSSWIDRLLHALETSKEKASASNAKAKILKEALSALGSGLGAPPSEKDITNAKVSAEKARTTLEEAASQAQYIEVSKNIEFELKRVAQAIYEVGSRKEAAELRRHDLQEQLGCLPKSPSDDPDKQALIQAIGWHASCDADECQVCGASVKKKHFIQRHAYLQGILAEVQEVESRRNELIKEISSCTYDITCRKNELSSLAFEQKQLELVAGRGEVQTIDLDSARKALEAAESQHRKLTDSRARWESTQSSRDQAVQAEQDATQWKALATACNEAVAGLLESGVVEFSAEVQRFLPATDKFQMKMGKTEAEFGLLQEDGTLFTALSGAEWARVLVALAETCSAGGHPTILIPPPGEFDPVTLTQAMEAFTVTTGQVIMCSPIMPERVPDGWTIVTRGKVAQPEEKPREVKKLAAAKKEVDVSKIPAIFR